MEIPGVWFGRGIFGGKPARVGLRAGTASLC